MARGVQLVQLVEKVRAEVGQSTSVSVGKDALPGLKQHIRRVQETLYDAYDWPFLRVIPFKTLSAGQRYYDFPSDLNMERVEEVQVWWNGEPQPVERGIDFKHYASYDPNEDERADPVLRWDVRWTGSAEQIEVWPIPATTHSASDPYRLQFKGIRKLQALTSDDDVCDLDDQLIVLHVAAEILTRQKSADAPAKVNAAKARYETLIGRTKGASAPFILGGGQAPRPARCGTIIRVR